jgi:2-polyprenyl-6-methoxyphenol hydroxylase and related FAD-dependent oxidoreductases
MQFHLDGYQPGDPEILDPNARTVSTGTQGPLPTEVDVLIVGCGPAGLTLAAQLSAFPDIKTCIVDQKSGPLLRGQADGIACRTMEMFEAFGFAERVLKESYWVNETSFWRPNEAVPGTITRSGRIYDTEDGLSEFPHVILNQARVHDFFLDVMRKSKTQLEPYYNRQLHDLTVDRSESVGSHPVTVILQRSGEAGSETEIVRARYVVGCDGARSKVRKSIGQTLHGDSANHAWGVMDVLAVTDFPDIRLKALIQSAGEGSIVLIPREGGYLVRIYVELDKLSEGQRAGNLDINADYLIAAAQRILKPYSLDVKEVAWWSVYEIGQRLCDRFDDVPQDQAESLIPRVFIAGDACHTHSPKAGQGMNVSMQDSFNLGWKLASVLKGQSEPSLLATYSTERQAIAKELIEFDREWARMLSASSAGSVDPAKTQDYFVRHGRYTAGTATRYQPSVLTEDGEYQHLALGFPIGMRFHSAPVIRLSDGKPMQLGHTIKADGRWRLFLFAGAEEPFVAGSALQATIAFLSGDPSLLLMKFTKDGNDPDSVIDVRAVLQQPHRDLKVEDVPPLLLPPKGRYGLRDYEKVFCPDYKGGKDVFEMRGIDRAAGCIVVVRPDQYVATVLPMDAHQRLGAFFDGFMRSVA